MGCDQGAGCARRSAPSAATQRKASPRCRSPRAGPGPHKDLARGKHSKVSWIFHTIGDPGRPYPLLQRVAGLRAQIAETSPKGALSIMPWKRVAPLAVAFAAAACNANGSLSNVPGAVAPQALRREARPGSASPIRHVIFIVQENRSFNNLFMGYPGAKTQNYGYDSNGKKIVLQPRKSHGNMGHRSFFAGILRSLRRQRKAARDALPDGWLEYGADESSCPQECAVLLRPRISGRPVLEDGQAVRARRSHVCVEPRRQLHRSSICCCRLCEPRRRHAVRRLGLRGRVQATISRRSTSSVPTARRYAPASTIRRSQAKLMPRV